MSITGNENSINKDPNANNISFTIKDTKLYVLVVTFSAKTMKNYQKFLPRDLKDQFIGTNLKQKVRIKMQQINLAIFSNKILLKSIYCLF